MSTKCPLRTTLVLLLIGTGFSCGDNVSPDQSLAPRTVGDHVRIDDRFSELRQVLESNDLLDAAEMPAARNMLEALDRARPLTLFAPTNQAIRALIDEFGFSILTELEELLRYHIHDGRLTASELERLTAITTLAEPDIHVRFGTSGILLNDGSRIVSQAIVAENGVIHVIDRVLRRPLVTTTSVFESAPNVPLPDGDSILDILTIAESGFLHDLRISIDIDHSRVSDLFVFLVRLDTGGFWQLLGPQPGVAPSGNLSNDIKTTFADSATFDVIADVQSSDPDGQAYPESAYRPVQALEQLVGLPTAGSYAVFVFDNQIGEVGQLNSWGMTATYGPEQPAAAILFPRQAPSAVVAKGFNEEIPVVVTRVAGLGGPIEISASADDLIATPVELADDGATLARLPVRTNAMTELGSRELVVTAESPQGASRIAFFEADVVLPDINGIELLAHVSLGELGGGEGNDIWGWTDPMTSREYAAVGTSRNTVFVDVTIPEQPTILGMLPTHTQESDWRDIKVYADHAFIVSEAFDHGMQVFDLTQLRGLTAPQTFSESGHVQFGNAHNVVINEDTGFAYVVGATDAFYPTTCFGGLLMFDLSTPTDPQFSGCFAGGVPLGETPGPDFPTDVYIHDAQCVSYRGPDPDYQGREVCVTSDGQITNANNYVGIADVTDKNNPIQIARVTYANAGYAHQGWLTEDHQYFILNDEFDEFVGVNTQTYVWDVRDLDAPILIGTFVNPRDAVGHNTYIKGNYAYQSNYTSGLRIVDLADIADGSAAEVAYFDTYPDDDGDNPTSRLARSSARCSRPTNSARGPILPHHPDSGESSCGVAAFQGAWSNYPFFASGVIVLSDIDRGLFVLRPTVDLN